MPFIDPGSKKDAAKETAASAPTLVRTSGVIPAPVRSPKSTPVPPPASAASARRSRVGRRAARRIAAAVAKRYQRVAACALSSERVFALRVRLADLLGLLHLFGFLGRSGRRVARRRLDLARLGELARSPCRSAGRRS